MVVRLIKYCLPVLLWYKINDKTLLNMLSSLIKIEYVWLTIYKCGVCQYA